MQEIEDIDIGNIRDHFPNYPTSPIISLKIYPTRIFSHHFTRLAFLKISLFSPNLLKIFLLGIFSKYFNPSVF